MPQFEYKVVPAPKKAGKIKGVKGTENRFAAQLSQLMNENGAEGWEYQRTDTLPCEERQGLTGRTTVFQNMLVFRREISAVEEKPVPLAITSQPANSVPAPAPAPAPAANAQPAAARVAPSEEPRVPTFRSAAIGTAPTVSAEVPEGKTPPIAAQ